MPHVRDVHDIIVGREKSTAILSPRPALGLEALEVFPCDVVLPIVAREAGPADRQALDAIVDEDPHEEAARPPCFNWRMVIELYYSRPGLTRNLAQVFGPAAVLLLKLSALCSCRLAAS